MRKLRGIADEWLGCSRLEWMADRENEGPDCLPRTRLR
ncbi:hypothetical protein [Streptomyces sp. cf386]